MQMDRDTIIELFDRIKPFKRNGVISPHRPLLVLYAIGKLINNEQRIHTYAEIEESFGKLLKKFGPRKTNKGTHDPFWRLKKYCVWFVTNADSIEEDVSGNVKPRELHDNNVSGGFHEAIIEQFLSDPTLHIEVTQMMLERTFHESKYKEVIHAVGIELHS